MFESVSTPLNTAAARLEGPETLLSGRSDGLSGDDREALRRALEALEHKRAAGDHSGEAAALNALGLVHHGLGNDVQALTYYLEGLAFSETLKDRRSELALLVNLSEMYSNEMYLNEVYLGEMYSSEVYLGVHSSEVNSGEAGLDADANPDPDPGDPEIPDDEHLRALEYTHRCLELSEETGNLATAAVSLRRLGVLYARQGDPDEALGFLGRSLELQRRLGDEDAQALTLCNLAEVSEVCAAEPEAAEHHREGLALACDPRVRAQLLASSGAYTQNLQGARQHLGEGLELAQQLGLPNLVRRCLGALYKLDKAEGKFGDALHHLEALQKATRFLENERAARRSRHLSVRLELEKTQYEAALQALLTTQTELNDRNSRLLERLREQTARLQQGATEDPLTGLPNRRYADRQLKREFVRARRYKRPLSVAVVAINDFGGIESFPPAVGEAVLKTLAKILSASLRPPDIAARYGAEEFALILPETDAVGGRTVCERVRRAVEAYRWRELHPELRVTLSAGLCSELDPVSVERMLSAADAKLQRTRGSGKNRVV